MTEVRKQGFGSYRACVEGSGVSSSLSVIYAAMARVLVSSVLTMTHVEGSYLSVLMVCSHGHSALLHGFRVGS